MEQSMSESEQLQRPCDEFFRPQFEDETKDQYARAWMSAINVRLNENMDEGQPRPGERLQWKQVSLMAKDLRPGMMISDGQENETWVRVHAVTLINAEPRARIVAVLRGVTLTARFAPSAILWALVPKSVTK